MKSLLSMRARQFVLPAKADGFNVRFEDRMLEGLDKINWSKLTHAYGTADDVPDLLRALATADSDERAEAIHDLYGNIWHQGTVYEASAYAVPFLLELLESPDVGGKDEILILLAHLAKGTSYHNVHLHLSLMMKEVEWQKKIEVELQWVRDVKAAVGAGESLYLGFLEDTEIRLRDAATYLLASPECTAPKLADMVWRRLEKESEERVRCSLLLAFGVLAERNESNIGALLAMLVGVRSKSVKLVSAMSLVRLAPAEPSEESLAILLEAVEFPQGYDALADSIWAQVDELEMLVVNHLIRLEGKAAQVAESTLTNILPTRSHSQALRIAWILLTIAFRTTIHRATFASLTEQQQRIARLIAESRNVWVEEIGQQQSNSMKASMMLRSCGLPDQQAKLVSFIRGEVDSQEKAGAPEKRPGFGNLVKNFFRRGGRS